MVGIQEYPLSALLVHPTRLASLGTLPVEGREGAKLSALLPFDGGGGPKGRRG
jgi:hypothetical protein